MAAHTSFTVQNPRSFGGDEGGEQWWTRLRVFFYFFIKTAKSLSWQLYPAIAALADAEDSS